MPREPHQLFDTPEQKADLEARNGLLQFDEIKKLVTASVSEFALTPDTLLRLHYAAIRDIYTCAGKFRTGPVYLARAIVDPLLHQPPPWEQVIPLVNDMCAHVNANFGKSAIHLASYVMWRVNWIHPFFEAMGERRGQLLTWFCAPDSDTTFPVRTQFRSKLPRKELPITATNKHFRPLTRLTEMEGSMFRQWRI